MSGWAARAKVHFLQECQNPTAKTAETPLLAVLAVPAGGLCENTDRVLAVLAVPIWDKPEKQQSDSAAANDPAPPPKKWNATIPPGTSPETLARFRAASLALDALQATMPLPAVDPDNPTDPADVGCWPASAAMTGREIDTFTMRLSRFTGKGVTADDAERLADKLVIRDREKDDRRLCLECLHLGGYGAGSWRCGAWRGAGVAIRARDNQLPADFVSLLQRCDGFSEGTR